MKCFRPTCAGDGSGDEASAAGGAETSACRCILAQTGKRGGKCTHVVGGHQHGIVVLARDPRHAAACEARGDDGLAQC